MRRADKEDATLPQLGATGREAQARQRAAQLEVRHLWQHAFDLPGCALSKGGVPFVEARSRPSSKEGQRRSTTTVFGNFDRSASRGGTALWLVLLFVLLALPTAISAQSLTITTDTLPDTIIGTTYPPQLLNAVGGTAPYTWSVSFGSLPPGLILAGNGTITGTTTSSGAFSFTVRVADSSNPQLVATKSLFLLVATALSVTTSSLPNGSVNTTYATQTLAAAGGTAPYSWIVYAGSLPPGLALSNSGQITGTPVSEGQFNFTLMVTDSAPFPQTATKSFALTIQPRLTIVSSSLASGVAGVFYTQQLVANGPTSVTWSIVGGNTPPGLSLASSGSISGTPSVAGTFEPLIQAASGDQSVRQPFRITINASLAITTAAALPDATLTNPYSVALSATGGVAPYTWSNPGRILPAGLTLSSSGVISGTPTGLGTFSFTAQVNDSFTPQQEATRTFTIVISASLTITTQTLPSAIQDLAYSQQMQATGGATPYTWVVNNGTLPSGLTLTTGGLLRGTPPTVGSESFSISVTDSRGTVSTSNFSIAVDPPLSRLSTTGLPASSKPAQQLPVLVSVETPHPSALSGKLTLAFTSKAEVATNDPMTQFSTGTRTVDFKLPANSTTAEFTSPILLMIGTVTGTIKLTANIENGPSDLEVATIEVLAEPPQLTNVEALLTNGGLDLLITGYSPARRITSVDFNFDVKNGGKTRRFTLTRNVDSQFASWYQNPASITYGSAFSFTQSFTLLPGNSIEAVSVTLKNAQGNTTSAAVQPH